MSKEELLRRARSSPHDAGTIQLIAEKIADLIETVGDLDFGVNRLEIRVDKLEKAGSAGK